MKCLGYSNTSLMHLFGNFGYFGEEVLKLNERVDVNININSNKSYWILKTSNEYEYHVKECTQIKIGNQIRCQHCTAWYNTHIRRQHNNIINLNNIAIINNKTNNNSNNIDLVANNSNNIILNNNNNNNNQNTIDISYYLTEMNNVTNYYCDSELKESFYSLEKQAVESTTVTNELAPKLTHLINELIVSKHLNKDRNAN